MRRNSSQPQPTPESFSTAFDSRLLLYTIAAGAAMASVPATSAEVLFTPSNASLKYPNKLAIDLDHDGSADFVLSITNCLTSYGTVKCFKAYGANPGNAIGVDADGPLALKKNARICQGPRSGWFDGDVWVGSYSSHNWRLSNGDRFLGIEFLINNEIHYGWIGFRSVALGGYPTATLAGWAYETDANKAIAAGDRGINSQPTTSVEPTSLEILAIGHKGQELRRK
jgi:hypothetical protein